MINYKIRPYQESDAKHVALLSKELGYLATSSDVERRFAILLKYTAIHGIFVAQLWVDIIGWIHVYWVHLLESDGYAEIWWLVVSQLHRKQWIGKELVQQAEEWAKSHEYTNLRLRSGMHRKNEAHLFYQAIGYEASTESIMFRKDLNL